MNSLRPQIVLVLLFLWATVVLAGPVGYSDKLLPPSGKLLSTGATPRVLFANTATARTILLAGATISNVGTAAHTVDIYSSGGTLLREFPLAPAASFGVACFDESHNLQSLPGEGLTIAIDAVGAAGDVVFTGQALLR